MAATFERASVTAELARAMIAAAEQKAAEMGQPFVIAIVDDSGVLKAFSRMDGAPLVSVQVAQDKAYTAVGFGLATDAWHDFVKNDPPLAMGAAPGIDRLIVFGGGYPIKVGEAVVGGIGVSGGHYSQDLEVAQAGLSALRLPRHPLPLLRKRAAECVTPGRRLQGHHPPPATEPFAEVHGLDARRQHGRLRPGPAQDAPQVRHDRLADVAVDGDLGQGRRAQHGPDGVRVPRRGQPEQFLMAVGEVVVLVRGDHRDRAADVLTGAGVRAAPSSVPRHAAR